jgi:poly(3-hydroxybutyrate) depolymerase
MLYQIYETQRSLIEPFADLAQAAAKLYANPVSLLGQTPMSQRVAAGYALMHRLGKDYEKPEFGIRKVAVGDIEVAIHERIEVDKPFCELRRFKRFSDDVATLAKLKVQPTVLVVAPLSGHYATLLREELQEQQNANDSTKQRNEQLSAELADLADGTEVVEEWARQQRGMLRPGEVLVQYTNSPLKKM